MDGLQIPKLHQNPGVQRRIVGILRHAGYTEARMKYGKPPKWKRYWKKSLIHTRDVAPSGYPAPDCFEKEKTVPDGCRINGVSGNQEQVDPVAGCRMKNHPTPSGTEKSHTNHGGAGLPDEPDTSIYPPKTKSDDSDDCKVF